MSARRQEPGPEAAARHEAASELNEEPTLRTAGPRADRQRMRGASGPERSTHTDTYEEVRDWFDNNTWAPWTDFSDLDEDLCEVVEFATDELLPELAKLGEASVMSTEEKDLRLHLTAALFFYVGHQAALGTNLDQGIESLLSPELLAAFEARTTLPDMPSLHALLKVVAGLTSDSPAWPW